MPDPEKITIIPDIGYAEDWPEITRLDQTFDAYESRMDGLEKTIAGQGGFAKKVAIRALLGNEGFSEQVSKWLRNELSSLREGEKTTGAAPVLAGGAMSRLVIADIAMTMIESLDAPGDELLALLMELLDLDRHRRSLARRNGSGFEVACQIEAQLPKIGVRKLAKMISVAPSRITEWRKNPDYHSKVEFYKKLFSGEIDRSIVQFVQELKKSLAQTATD